MDIHESEQRGYYVADLAGGGLHSTVDPYREARELLPESLPDHERFVVFGAGLGYILEALRKRCDQPRVLVFEPHPKLLEEGRKRGIWDPDPFFQFIPIGPNDPELIDKLFRFLPLEVMGNYTAVHWNDYRAMEPGYFDRMETQLRGLREHHRQNLASLRDMGTTWLRNIRRNLSHLYDHRVPDPDPFDGAVAVVGAGPSLDEQLPWLKENEQRLSIFAINTAGPVLSHHDIDTDVHFAVDSRRAIVLDLRESPLTHVMASPNVSPDVFRFTPNFSFLGLLSPLSNWLHTASFIPRIPSKSAGVPSIVEWLGRSGVAPVYLLGCDLGVRHGRFYARGTRRERKALSDLNRFQHLPQWHLVDKAREEENPLWGQEDWMRFRSNTEDFLRVPEPAPSWWEGQTVNDPVEVDRDDFTFRPVPPGEIQQWAKKQTVQLNRLRDNPHDASDPWQQFWFWVHKLCAEPADELQQWHRLFEQLSDGAANS